MYEEFRLWQFVENLHIYKTAENGVSKSDCTAEYIPNKAELVKWLLTQKEITEHPLLSYLAGKKAKDISWNYVSDKKYPMAPVTATISSVLEEAGGKVSAEALVHIWHILYSVSDKEQLSQALSHYAEAHHLSSLFVEKLGKQKLLLPNTEHTARKPFANCLV